MIDQALADAGLSSRRRRRRLPHPIVGGALAEYLGVHPQASRSRPTPAARASRCTSSTPPPPSRRACATSSSACMPPPREATGGSAARRSWRPSGPSPGAEWEWPYGLRMPMGPYAMAATRHMARCRHDVGAAGPDRRQHPGVGHDEPEGPLPGRHHHRRRARLADAVPHRCTCSTAAWSPTAPAPS